MIRVRDFPGKVVFYMADLVSMGELLIDFTPVGETEDGRLLFARNPGAPPPTWRCRPTGPG